MIQSRLIKTRPLASPLRKWRHPTWQMCRLDLFYYFIISFIIPKKTPHPIFQQTLMRFDRWRDVTNRDTVGACHFALQHVCL